MLGGWFILILTKRRPTKRCYGQKKFPSKRKRLDEWELGDLKIWVTNTNIYEQWGVRILFRNDKIE